jgi:uncharacterized protein (TIGR02594 family)
MSLPAKYAFLKKLKGPKMILEGLKIYGIKEIPGKRHNEVILNFAKLLGIGDLVKTDELAWCGLVHAYLLMQAGKEIPLKGYDLLRAAKYVAIGNPVDIDDAMLGDTLVFKREGGGHVGTYVGESDVTFHVMGGNQSNQFNIIEIAKARCIAVRRPHYNNQPEDVKKYFIGASGKVSTNEA